ncbi:MAG: PRTRC system ParB family protein [Candidatus Competibacteraceae bacterium]|nr:PRTRC system ParB family protein [Candidatus Competibacteraceae bacterium]
MNAPLHPAHTTPAPESETTALPFSLHEGRQAYLPLDWIIVKDGFNPRHFFEDQEFKDLVQSVKAQGVLQALWVRPVEDFDPTQPRFWLIAGERRLRAGREAGVASIPAIVRLVDERQALVLAELENNPALRINLSVAEEARFAQRFVAQCDGDRVEAAKLLGWSKSKLDARLLLLHATEKVLDALTERKIKLGHAELLAGLPPSTQDGTLAKIISDQFSVSDLKARIKGFALDLQTAIFDKTDCTQCPHNSSLQGTLFGECVESGRCQNRECFGEKTQQALAAKKTELETEYPAVFLDSDRAAEQYTVLSKEGPQGVGDAQFNACQGCKHFAAKLSTQPGLEGTVQAPLCVNLACHAEKVTAAQPPAATEKVVPISGNIAERPTPPSSATPGAKPAQADATPKKVEVWVDAWFRDIAAQTVVNDAELCRAWLLYSVYKDAGQPMEILQAHQLAVSTADTRATLVPKFIALDSATKQALLKDLMAHLVRDKKDEFNTTPGQGELVKAAVASVQAVNVDLAQAFTPNEAFWQAHTRAGIESLLSDAKTPDGLSFAEWYARQHAESDTDQKAFERLMKGKVADVIKALGKSAFDWSAWLPAVIGKRLKATNPR